MNPFMSFAFRRTASATRARPYRPRPTRPAPEALEDRCLLSLDSLVVRAAPSGPDKATSVAAWTDVSDLGGRVTTAAGSDRTLTLRASPELAVMWPVSAATWHLINHIRYQAGLPDLTRNARLFEAAEIHVGYLAAHDGGTQPDNGHVFHDEPLPYPTNRVQSVGYSFSNVGEIWYSQGAPVGTQSWDLDQSYAVNAVNGWMNDPPHRAIILNPNFTEIGMAVTTLPNGHVYQSVVFARPR